MKEEPLFILGNPRSGTSLFRIMLSNHKDICIPPECGFIQWWYAKYSEWDETYLENEVVSAYVSDLSTSKKIESWNLDFEALTLLIHEKRPTSYADLSLLVIKQYANQQDFRNLKYLGDKNNYYLSHLELIKDIYPNARFLILVRDGRDVASSYIKLDTLASSSAYKPKLPVNIEEIAMEWKENNEKLINFSESNGNVMIVKYENIVTESEYELERICEFLELDFDSQMLRYFESDNKNIEPSETLDWKRKTLEKPDLDNIGKFKKELSELEIRRFESIASGLLERFDYARYNQISNK